MRAILSMLLTVSVILVLPGYAVGEGFVAKAQERYGDFGKRAAEFLLRHMPEADRAGLTDEFAMEHLDFAMRARETYPWAKRVPEEIFWNDVLPYAVFDEARDPWRRELSEMAGELVKEATTASEAAQILNRDFFNRIKTHYDTGREKANQSPAESIRQGKASCTGLSIILVCACRSVGIPARAVGTPLWWNESGNHTWVEIWDGDWHFTGADEYDKGGLNRGWFVKNAAQAVENDPRKAIYATSWRFSEVHFPLVWAPENRAVGAVNVTRRYARTGMEKTDEVGVRLLDGDGKRMAADGWLTKISGYPLEAFRTKACKADMNDTAMVKVPSGQRYRWRFSVNGRWMESEVFRAEKNRVIDVRIEDLNTVPDFMNPEVALSKQLSQRAIEYAYDEVCGERKKQMREDLDAKAIAMDGLTMRWMERTYGSAPEGERSLWISMHGGGEAPKEVNDRQWQNQIRLYQPEEGIYVAPRAPTDKWNMWHQAHIDPMFGRLIESMVALRGVHPDKVYLTGYSAGGDGVWQVAPRMADRFAAAAMMAGHPNEARLDGLRNLPFAIFMGEKDQAFGRAQTAMDRSRLLADLRKNDSGGYEHFTRIYEGMGHWMNGKDAEGIPWMAKYRRNPWPRRVVWYQDDVTHDRFYWLRMPAGAARKDQRITASVDGQVIRLAGDVPKGTTILLSDQLLDLDEPVEVWMEDREIFRGTARRTYRVIQECLRDRLDPNGVAVAQIECP